jgi:hypothetical protein
MKEIAQSFLVILSGFVTVVGLSGIAAAVVKRTFPGLEEKTPADPFAMAMNVGVGLAASLTGGYVTARLSAGNPIVHTLMLALVVLLFSAFSAVQMKDRQPILYLLVLTVVPPLAVLCGGLLRLRQLGIAW